MKLRRSERKEDQVSQCMCAAVKTDRIAGSKRFIAMCSKGERMFKCSIFMAVGWVYRRLIKLHIGLFILD